MPLNKKKKDPTGIKGGNVDKPKKSPNEVGANAPPGARAKNIRIKVELNADENAKKLNESGKYKVEVLDSRGIKKLKLGEKKKKSIAPSVLEPEFSLYQQLLAKFTKQTEEQKFQTQVEIPPKGNNNN